MKIGPYKFGWLDILLVCVPLCVVLKLAGVSAVVVFVVACLAILPLAGWMGKATEHLAAHFGAGIGGLLNATFGNLAEFIIAFLALRRGLVEVVKASITGSIIGNVLLVLGLSLLVGGFKRKRQEFNPTAAALGATLLAVSAVGLLAPSLFSHFGGEAVADRVMPMSIAVSVILLVAYLASLFFSLKTHQHLYEGGAHHHFDEPWSRKLAFGTLIGATALVALVAEFLVASVEDTADAWGMSHVFVGVILVAIVGNAAEHSSAILVAAKDKMDLAIGIAVGSGIQIALLIAPALVMVGLMIGQPMDLVFTPMEIFAVGVSVIIVKFVAYDGRSHWMEGVLLLAAYAILGVIFFFMPDPVSAVPH